MFELGIRLTFDKPTVVVKDEETDYSFDTSPIEHAPYPSSLHYHEIVRFKKRLADKIIATQKAAKDPKYLMRVVEEPLKAMKAAFDCSSHCHRSSTF